MTGAWRPLLETCAYNILGSREEARDRLQQHFNKQEIGNLTLAITHINSWNRLTQCFRPEPGEIRGPRTDSGARLKGH